MVSQNNELYGVVGSSNNTMLAQFKREYPEREQWLNICLNQALSFISDRGLGNIDFYLKKLNIAYNDEYSHKRSSLL